MKKITFMSLLLVVAILLGVTGQAFPEDEPAPLSERNVIDRQLSMILEQSDPEELISVGVWIRELDTDAIEQEVLAEIGLNKALIARLDAEDIELDQKAVDSYIVAERNLYKSLQLEASRSFLNRITKESELSEISEERIKFISGYAPTILMELTSSEIMLLASDDEVDEILYAPSFELADEIEEVIDVPETLSAQNTTEIAFNAIRIPQVHAMGYTGEGIKIGQIEPTVPDTSLFPNASITIGPGSHGVSNHSIMVFNLMYDIAPDAEYFCIPSSDEEAGYIFYDSIEWLITQGVHIINYSAGVAVSSTYGMYNQQCKWIDHLAINHSVHFVKSAGNRGGSDCLITSPGMSYNAIVVGAANSSLSARWSGSSYLNSATLTDRWAYKPDIIAPGQDLYFETLNTSVSGTSLSAPIVTGISALMMQSRSALKTRQDALKACLLASINNEDLRYVPGTDGYNECGAGLVDAYSAVRTAKYGRYSRDLFFQEMLYPGIIQMTEFPVSETDDIKRVALTWLMNSRASGSHGYEDASNTNYVNLSLDIKDPNGNSVCYCYVLNGNVQIAEFVPEIYGTYTAWVSLNGMPLRKLYYAVAWW